MTMERRDALKALGTLAAATGMSVSPVTARDAEAVEIVVLRPVRDMSEEDTRRLREAWAAAVNGTSLEHARLVVVTPDVAIEFVRGKR